MRQLMHSFKGKKAPTYVLEGLANGSIRAICLFAFNVESPQQVREMCLEMRQAARDNKLPPPIIGIDQEGGQLIAISNGATELPGNMALGATRSPELARQAGYVLGRELLAMGVNLNFAPSLDVNNNAQNPVIGIRAFSDEARLVGELGAALIQGMQGQGVIATAKHFPGHGDTSGDSHHAAPVVHHSLERIYAMELLPFKMAIEAGVKAIMSSHIVYTALDADSPATLSEKVMHDILRGELGFQGLMLTDAMDMHGVAHLGHDYSLRQALWAGNDLLCLGHVPDHEGWSQKLSHWEFVQAIQRIEAAQKDLTWQMPDFTVVGCAEHQVIAQEIADKSITVVRDTQQVLPLKLKPEQKITVITVRPADLTPADTSSMVKIRLAEFVQKRHANTVHLEISHQATEDEIRNLLDASADADTVIVGTINAEIYQGQAALVNALQARGQAPIVIALRTPYDLMAFPTLETYLCTYGIRPVSMEAVTRVLFGEIQAQGILPCQIPNITEGVA